MYALPTQWLALMLIVAFTGVLPTSGLSDPLLFLEEPSTFEEIVDRLEHMILPAFTLGVVLLGAVALIIRSALLETLGEDYILTARAKGLRPWAIVTAARVPQRAPADASRSSRSTFGLVAGGAILVETVFSYPGVGL